MTNLKKIAIGVASAALVAGMGIAPANAATIELPNGLKVDTDKQRYAGEDRVETSLAIAKAAWGDREADVAKVYLTGYNGLVDAAGAGMLDNNTSTIGAVVAIPTELKDQKLFALSIKKAFPRVKEFIAIGGTGVVSDESLKIMAEVAEVNKTSRIGGKDRYETNIAIAKKVFASPSRAYLTRGDNMADALVAGTLEKGPVVLVPQNGDVPAATQNYLATLNPSSVAVIGGEGALSDEQASKVFKSGKAIETTPWNAAEFMAKAKTDIQMYAALYFGQSAWQQQTDKLSIEKKGAALPYDKIDLDKPDHDGNPATAVENNPMYFGVGGSAATAGETEDAADIFVGKAETAKKVFAGYKPLADKVKKVADFLDKQANVFALKQKLALEVKKAVEADTKISALDGTDEVSKAIKALYGASALTDNPIEKSKDGKEYTSTGLFEADSTTVADAKFTGLNAEAIKDQVAADKKSKDKKWAVGGRAEGSDIAIAELVKHDDTDIAALFTAHKADDTNTKTNWVAIQELVNERKDMFDSRVAASKEKLVDAIRAWYMVTDDNASSMVSSSGAVRIAGSDRYETAAKLSIFQSKTVGKTGFEGEDRIDSMKHQYLASGANANLIDSVFAGQLKKGTILLVPPQGELSPLTKLELKRKGQIKTLSALGEGIFPSMVYTMGGKGAVSDDTFIAAINVMTGTTK